MNAAQEKNTNGRQRVEDRERNNNNNGASERSGKSTLNITFVHERIHLSAQYPIPKFCFICCSIISVLEEMECDVPMGWDFTLHIYNIYVISQYK